MSVTLRISHALSPSFRLEIDLVLAAGVTAFVGPSGSGKSSTILFIAGLLPEVRGDLSVDGEIWDDRRSGQRIPPEARGVALVPQGLGLFPHLDVLANVAFPLAGSRAERLIRAKALLDRLQIGHLGRRLPRDLSGGEAQRVAFARAMARSPRLVLLDEPFSALDRATRQGAYEALDAWLVETGVPAILVTHDDAEAARFGATRVVFERGRATPQNDHGEPPEGGSPP